MTAPTLSRDRQRARQIRTQPFRILVASDAEPASIGAVRVATILARRRSASVHALTVATPFPHTLPSVFAVAPPVLVDDENRRTSLEHLRTQLATVRGTRDWTMRATTGFAADSINSVATRWPASLIIMGSGSHRFTDRLIGSETAIKVAGHATVPVMIVPADAHALPTRAVAAVDFSESSVEAARFAATLLGARGILTLFYASPLIMDEGPAGTLTDLYTVGARDRLLEVAAEIHRRSKRTVQIQVASGGIIDRLMDFVETARCDLIAMGTHEPTFLERLLVGRVRTSVIRAATCAVLVVPPGKSE
jgi:nucleotide-binding universal stress UspA family protein